MRIINSFDKSNNLIFTEQHTMNDFFNFLFHYLQKEEILLENYSEDDEKDDFYFLLKESLGDFNLPDDDFSDDKDYGDEDFDEDEGEDKPLK